MRPLLDTVGALSIWAMRVLLPFLLLCWPISAVAQVTPETAPDPDQPLYLQPPDLELIPSPEEVPDLDEDETEEEADEEDILIEPALPPAPDYSRLPPRAEKRARLLVLFERLASLTDKSEVERAELVSEEIWAHWMDSGSASVNYLLVRADAAQRKGDSDTARFFLDTMVDLEPDFAEAYARSARLALSDEDYSRAVEDATRALILEPRHFYALYTLGSTLERLGKTEEALEVYEEAHALFPLLGGVKERLDALRRSVNGDVL